MKSLSLTLSVFFVVVFGILTIDRALNEAVTARGLIGSALAGAVVTFLCVYRLRQQAAEQERQERLRRRAEAARLVDVYRRRLGQVGESCGGMLVVCLAVVVVLLFLLSGLVRAEGCGFDAELRALTAELQPEVLLTADELDELRALTLSAALLIRRMQTPPSGMKADMQNRRVRVLRTLDTAQEGFIGVTVDHAGTVLRRLPR